MTVKKILLAAALLVGTTSITMAQGFYGQPYYGSYGYGQTYDYSAGAGPYAGRHFRGSGPGYYENDTNRGGSGPRVGGGSGMGIGAER
jgi:hypothetical protein